MMRNTTLPKEGEVYRTYTVDQHTFEIRYGYHEENERGRVEPLPIFPDFEINPVYTQNGEPITAYVQYPCKHYSPRDPKEPEEWCGDCTYYDGGRIEMGRCLCPQRKQK